MANTKQAIKMVRKTKRKTDYNKSWKNKVKVAVKALNAILSQTDLSSRKKDIKQASSKIQKRIDKAVKNGVLHKNKGNRMKSSISKRIFVID